MTVEFHDSFGRTVADFDRDALLAMIADGSSEMWTGPAGQSALSSAGDQGKAWLFLTLARPGWFYVYGQGPDGRKLYLAGSPAKAAEEFTVYIGGMRLDLSGRLLTRAEEAARIARAFLETGRLAPDAAWVEERDDPSA